MAVFPIFPRSGFDQSVTTPVLLGLLVSWMFTETLGWVFAGLVVPGYIASVFLLDPAGGLVDVLEAALTYAVARVIGEQLPRTGIMSRVFGRERFFLVVLVSILVRLAVEAWLLPRLRIGAWAYSVGLVVVPLAANACWKTGFWRGVVQNGVPTLIVYLLLRYVLAPYTNLSLAGFELATENVAASFLASPKAYILLLTGGAFAAAANLRYGWDFNGLLVPALLALALFEPVKFATTFAETLIVYGLVTLLVRFTPLRRTNIEGPRRTVLFFTVDYGLRFAFAAALGRSLPGGDIVAFIGFGYLLPTLLAVKISQRASVPLVLLPTLKVSVLGFVVGTLLGFVAKEIERATGVAQAMPQVRALPAPPRDPTAAALWASALSIENAPEPDATLTGDLSRLREVFDAVAGGDVERARAVGLEPSDLDGGVTLLRERFETLAARRGIPSYLFRRPTGAPGRDASQAIVLVPTPLASPAAAVAAGRLVARGDADVAVLAGVEEPSSHWLETTAHAAARLLAQGRTLVVLYAADAPLPRGLGVRDPAPEAPPVVARIAHQLGDRPGVAKVIAASDGEVDVAIDPAAVAAEVEPPRAAVDLSSATAMAMALDDVRPASATDEEHLVALRRLLLEPILTPGARESARALAPFAAAALGYRLTAPARWTTGEQAVALLPVERERPIALFVRTGGVPGRVLEAPAAGHRGIRDLALRVGASLGVDAIVLGWSWHDDMHDGALRAAHAAATTGPAPEVFLLRDDPAESRRLLKIGAWMDDGAALARGRRAAESLGLTAADAPVDPALRELATHTLLRPTPVVAFAASPTLQEAASLDAARLAWGRFHGVPALLRDGTLAEATRLLAASLDDTRPPAADGVVEAARSAATETSVVAMDRLFRALRAEAANAAVVRTKEDTFLAVVARRGRPPAASVSVVTVAFGGSGASDAWRYERRPRASACIDAPLANGACEGSLP
jgi:hypothetical protein